MGMLNIQLFMGAFFSLALIGIILGILPMTNPRCEEWHSSVIRLKGSDMCLGYHHDGYDLNWEERDPSIETCHYKGRGEVTDDVAYDDQLWEL